MVFTRKDGDFHGRTVSLPEGRILVPLGMIPVPLSLCSPPRSAMHIVTQLPQHKHLHEESNARHGRCRTFSSKSRHTTLPETNSSPLKIGHPNRKLVFQPSIFRGYVSFREGSSDLLETKPREKHHEDEIVSEHTKTVAGKQPPCLHWK